MFIAKFFFLKQMGAVIVSLLTYKKCIVYAVNSLPETNGSF